MQLTQKQLDTHLKSALSSLYLISGDEDLLVQDARNSIVTAAKKKGFNEKHICHMDGEFSIDTLTGLLQNQDLFFDKKIIDIRNASAKFDKATLSLLEKYLSTTQPDQIIIISTTKLSAAQQKTPWFELIKKKGNHLFIWPISTEALPNWIMERAKNVFSLTLSIDVARLLAHFSEGNLLSAAQSLEKLKLLHPNSEITREQLITVLSDHARFSIFDLSDAIKRKDAKKIARIIARLAQTGEEPPLVLWAICRQLRESDLSGTNKKALQYAARVDEIIKGARTGDVWQALLELSLMVV